MTKSHSQTPAQETDRRPDAVHGRHMDETEPKAEGSDTEHDPGSKSGLEAEPVQPAKRSPDPTGDTKTPPKTGLEAEPIDEPQGGKLGLSASPAAKSPADR